ncbi:MAG: hypothetical protein JST04_12050 [Bdellovibrionales bacterium]|nr:hypothetical protein [Bdellovibrionales bacterium]
MKTLARLFHYFVYANLITGFLSALYMVFVVYHPEGGGFGPLWGASRQMPHDLLVERRLYAIEAWITFGFLATYFALTRKRD